MATDYGTDVYCVQDLDPYFSLVSGAEGVAQALARRLQTPQGGLLTDPSYGYDLRALVNASLTAADLLAAQSAIEYQCLLDQRVDSVEVQITVVAEVAIVTVDPILVDGETFTLTFELSPTNSVLVYQGVTWPDGSVSYE